MNIKYFARVLSGASFGKLNNVIKNIHGKTGKSSVYLFLDIMNCFIRYGAGYNDYSIFEYYNMNAGERSTFLTRMKNKKLISMLNDEKFSRLFDNKGEFDKRFSDLLGRGVLDLDGMTKNSFTEFIDGQDVIFAKPYIGESGKGIEKLHPSDFSSPEEMYFYVTDPAKNFGVLEHEIKQHPDAARIYPCSLNCFRIVTLLYKGVPHILYAVFKTGNNGHYVDNLESGGLACHFDLDKGEIVGRGHTSALINYDAHPYTGIKFVGYKLPYMDEVKELVKKAALRIPEVGYVGWDVCLTPTGPAIVEGNDFPAYDFPQLPDPDRPKIGLLKQIREIIPNFR